RGNPDLPPVPRCDSCNMATHPARMVVACTIGHIDDFPWYRWVHRGQNCGRCPETLMRMSTAFMAADSFLSTEAWQQLRRWYGLYGRHQLPWRRERSPWRVLVAETLL